jgi:peptidoglycan/LPS O-acetylase OafA/YrhL
MTKSDPTRLPSLDSLRGLAALSVVFCHVLWLYRPNSLRLSSVPPLLTVGHLRSWVEQLPGTFLIEVSPLHLITSGHEAVILFYLISGCVLYLSCERHAGHHPYRDFLVRRVCRLYIPYFAGLAFAVALNATVSTGHLAGMNDWINHTWLLPIDRRAVLSHIALVGNFNTDLFLMPCWTLVHEMRLAFVFPLLSALVLSRSRWLPAVIAALSLSGIGLDALFADRYGNYFITVHYAALFLAGAWLARERVRCASFWASLGVRRRAFLVAGALALYGYGRIIALVRFVPASTADLPIAAGAACLIVWAMGRPPVLDLAPIRWLGRVCYGLYLLHLSFILASMYLLRGLLPLWTILILAIAMSFAAAELFRRIVEGPAILLGQQLTSSSSSSSSKGTTDLATRDAGAAILPALHGVPR